MDHNELKDLAAAYSLGSLDPDEKRQFEAHLRQDCEECQTLVKEMQEVTIAMGQSVQPEQPPSHIKERIFAAIEEEKSTSAEIPSVGLPLIEKLRSAKRRWQFTAYGLAFASILLFVLFSIYSSGLKSELDLLETRMEAREKLIQNLRTELNDKARVLQIMRAPQLKIADLNGLPPSPEAKGKVIWNPENDQAVFYGFNLAAIPSDKDYQLWMLKGNQPISAGVFTPDADGNAISEFTTIADDENISAFAVTLEPKGGVAQPTGEMYLIGAL